MGIVFEAIAPVYGLFFGYQKRYFQQVLKDFGPQIGLSNYRTVLDVGCGTGAMCAALADQGLHPTGVDTAKNMIKIAKAKTRGVNARFIHIDPTKELPFGDNRFDVAICSYVAHGMKQPERLKLYKEMARVAKHVIIIHDYNENRARLTDIIEFVERGDYFNFIKQVKPELQRLFPNFQAIDLGGRGAWYVARP